MKTPFHDFHVAAGARMVDFAGFRMPVQYKGIQVEHQAVRNNVGLFDLSHMGEFEVNGKDAEAFLQKTTTNNVADLDQPGKIQYSCLPTEDGGIVDDLLVYRLEDRYFLVVNAANIKKDFDHLSKYVTGDVNLVDRSPEYGLLAIQGPNAEKLLAQLTDHDLNNMAYYTSAVAKIAGEDVLFSRTGYTGEDGFELYIEPAHCGKLWNEINAVGSTMGMELVGLGARDTLRMEMKMPLYGNDIDETTSPIEAGLSFIVDLTKDFIGKSIVEKHKQEKPSRRLVCLEAEGKGVPRQGFEIFAGDEAVGQVTSGTFSPSLKKPIALGYVRRGKTKSGNELEIDIRGRRLPAVVVKPPFYKNASHK
ncbi:glycine cleavage system aminomethyltransferase GcvT [candidate division GN15 bacterium]|nr:glycine cleavage system aminomethyltransferase GcvT [candidate division GN15 bacterium]